VVFELSGDLRLCEARLLASASCTTTGSRTTASRSSC
jgi:hypothetical protein